jgi:hypothetical protein
MPPMEGGIPGGMPSSIATSFPMPPMAGGMRDMQGIQGIVTETGPTANEFSQGVRQEFQQFLQRVQQRFQNSNFKKHLDSFRQQIGSRGGGAGVTEMGGEGGMTMPMGAVMNGMSSNPMTSPGTGFPSHGRSVPHSGLEMESSTTPNTSVHGR